MNNSHVFSTGQSWQDLIDLSKLAALLPTEPPPVLTDPDYAPLNKGAAMTIAYASTSGLVWLLMLIRTLARSRFAKFGVEDALVTLALSTIVGNATLACLGAEKFQWGYSSHDLRIRSIVYTIKFNYAIHCMTAVGSASLRVVFLLMLRDRYWRLSNWWKWWANVGIGLSVVVSTACILGFVFQCSRVTAGFDLWERVRTKCNAPAMHLPSAIAYLFNDILVMLVGAKLALRKWQAMAMEILGITPLAAALARVYFWRPTVYLDWFDMMMGTISSQIELISAFVIACFPSFDLLLESDISFEAVIPKRLSRRTHAMSEQAAAGENRAKSNNRDSRALDREVLDDDPIQEKAIVRLGSKGSHDHSPTLARGGPLSGNVEYREHELEFETVVFDGDAEREKKCQRTMATASAPTTAPHSPTLPDKSSRHTMHFETPSSGDDEFASSSSSGWTNGERDKGRLSTIRSVYEGRRMSDSSDYASATARAGFGEDLGMDVHPAPPLASPSGDYALKMASAGPDARSTTGSVSPMSRQKGQQQKEQNQEQQLQQPQPTFGGNTIGPGGVDTNTPRTGYGYGGPCLFNYNTTGNMNSTGPKSYPKISPIFSVPDVDDDNDSNVSPTASATAVVSKHTYTGGESDPGPTPGGSISAAAALGQIGGFATSDRKDSDVLSGVGSTWRQNARLSTISSFYNRSRNNSSYSLPDEDTDQQLQYVKSKSIDDRMRKVV